MSHLESLTDELRRLVKGVKRGRGQIDDGTFHDLAHEAYRILLEADEDEDVLPNEDFDKMLHFSGAVAPTFKLHSLFHLE